jgi:two-component system sensor histidine kinase YesM
MKPRENFFSNLGLKGKFIVVYIIIVTVLLAMTGFIYFKTTSDVLYNMVTTDTTDILVKNNLIIDQKLGLLNEYANGLMVDNDLAGYLDTYHRAENIFDIYNLDRSITTLLNKYFLYSGEVFSTNLVTKRTVFGQTAYPTILPVEHFQDTEVYRKAAEAHGKTVWIPTYDFFKMFGQQYIPSKHNLYQYVFSAAKMIRTFDDDYVVLVLNFSDDIYKNIFATSSRYLKGDSFVVAPDSTVVFHSDRALLGTKLDTPWLNAALEKRSGFNTVQIDGKSYIVCFDTSVKTGWLSGVVLEKKVLMEDYIKIIVRNMLLILAFLVVLPLIVVMFISGSILSPMESLRRGMKESGQGRFDTEVRESGSKELRQLIRRFNTMNGRIQQLIRENYEAIIMKKEAELNAYNLQLNPHFLSNSLNMINLELIRIKEYELSDMVVELSEMMDYTLKASSHLVSFKDDWKHTHNYLKVMQRRHNKQFEVQYDIEPELYRYSVPKFFLQPLVENSIVHGFENLRYMGVLRINGFIRDGKRVFIVEDNGKGIDEYTKNRILNGDENKAVGINNIRYRIKYVYGDEYEITIESEPYVSTKVTVVLPLES